MSGAISATQVAAGSSIVSGISGAVNKSSGSSFSSSAQSAAAGYNAQIADNNAKANLNNAALVAAEGDVNATTEGLKTKAKIAGTLANQGASGVNVNSGSAVAVRASEAAVGQQNAMQIRAEAVRRAHGYQVAAYGDESQAALDRASAKNAKTAGKINADAGVLGGISDMSGKLTTYMQNGGPLAGITSSDSGWIDDNTPIDAYTGEDYSEVW